LAAKDKEGMTARDWAIKHKRESLLPLLGDTAPKS
jgi:hypothetical protein